MEKSDFIDTVSLNLLLLFVFIPVIFRFPYLLSFSKSCNIFSKESNEDLSF